MREWEYRTLDLNDLPRKTEVVDVLNDAGENGWELVTITPNQIAYLKREAEKRHAKSAPKTTPPPRKTNFA
jgi:Domain of unknown function (DUF4177)